MKKKSFREIILPLILLTLCAGYAFFQRLGTPISEIEAMKLLSAHSFTAFKEGQFPIAEWPFFWIGSLIFGVSPYAVITAFGLLNTAVMFCGLLLIRAVKPKGFIPYFFFLTLIGTPTKEMIGLNRQDLSITLCVLIAALCLNPWEKKYFRPFAKVVFFAAFFSITQQSPLAGLLTLLCVICAAPISSFWVGAAGCLGGFFLYNGSFPHITFHGDILRTLNTIQKFFKADFSGKVLLAPTTGRYFLYSLLILMCGTAWVFCLLEWVKKKPHPAIVRFFVVLVPLFSIADTLFPSSCGAWCEAFPTAGAVLITWMWHSGKLNRLKIAEYRLPFRVPLTAFLLLCLLFGMEQLPTSRTDTPEDRLVRELSAQGLQEGTCPIETVSRFTVASKGKISFHTRPFNENSLPERSEKGDFEIFLSEDPNDVSNPWVPYQLRIFR